MRSNYKVVRDHADEVWASLSCGLLWLKRRYPFLPTLPSLMQTIEATSRARMNVIQLSVTRETASWLAGNDGQEEGDTDGRQGAKHGWSKQLLMLRVDSFALQTMAQSNTCIVAVVCRRNVHDFGQGTGASVQEPLHLRTVVQGCLRTSRHSVNSLLSVPPVFGLYHLIG